MLQSNYDEPSFHVKNPSVTCDQNQDISFRLINQFNEISKIVGWNDLKELEGIEGDCTKGQDN